MYVTVVRWLMGAIALPITMSSPCVVTWPPRRGVYPTPQGLHTLLLKEGGDSGDGDGKAAETAIRYDAAVLGACAW